MKLINKAGGLYCFVTYQLGPIDFRSNHLAKQCFEISGHEPFLATFKGGSGTYTTSHLVAQIALYGVSSLASNLSI